MTGKVSGSQGCCNVNANVSEDRTASLKELKCPENHEFYLDLCRNFKYQNTG